MPILTPFKALRSVRKTPASFEMLLRDVSQEQAVSATDGPDGWSVLFIMCHVRDYEGIYTERITMILEQDDPQIVLPPSNDQLAVQNNYAGQNLREVFEDYLAKRRALIARLESIGDEQWLRRGTMPKAGENTVLDMVVNTALHDVDHIEQVARTLGKLS